MKIESPAFKNGQRIPEDFTGEGKNVSPKLIISSIPLKTKSMVLICDDPDAEKIAGKVWSHWILFNIPFHGEDIEIKENAFIGSRGVNDFKVLNYKGPMPPKGSGEHRYFFRVYALSRVLELKEGASRTEVEIAMKNLIIDKTEFQGVYSRD